MNEKDLAIECISATYERANKRLWILCLVIFITCACTNLGWVFYESQYETVERTEVRQENESGYNNYIGNDGDINNGEADDNQN